MRKPVDLKRNPNDVVVVLVVAAIIIVAYMYVCMYMTCVVQVFAFCIALIQICTIIIILQ